LDVKNAPSVYSRSVGASVRPHALADTLELLKTRFAGRAEVRLTWVPGLNDPADLAEYAEFVGPGIPVWVQSYRPGPVLDPSFDSRGPTPAEISEVVEALVAHGVDARSR
jgi:pyruvate-formate lyase-activating enzyme